jgi:hypothetical protein
MSSLLIITTGQTDVQFVNGDVRQELEGKICGKLHDQIKERSWHVVDVPNKKDSQRVSTLSDGDLRLCTPKLDAVLNYFGDKLPSAALILETCRARDSDPRFAGSVLECRLKQKGVSLVYRRAFLKNEEYLEDLENDLDAVVRREVVDSLWNAIAEAFRQVEPQEIFAATTGGMAPVNAVVEELTRLLAVAYNAQVTVLEVPDASMANQGERAIEERFHPAAGIRARWQALSLIQKGSLLGAWGAIGHIKDQPGQEWSKVVEWLACFASSLPIDPQCHIQVLRHPRMAVRAALRVELALKAGDIPRAVHGTVAFFEAALWDFLSERVERHPTNRKLFKFKPGCEPQEKRLFRKNDGSKDDRNAPFEPVKVKGENRVQWYKIDDSAPCADQLVKRYLQKPCLERLSSAVENVRYLRNDVDHNEPTPELMKEAETEMQKAQLWSNSNPPQFLSQPPVQDVLKCLGIDEPQNLCVELMETVKQRILAHPTSSRG